MKKIIKELNELEITYENSKLKFKIGDKYNKLTIIKLVNYQEDSGRKSKGCICQCECGNIIGPIRLRNLLNGDNMSCGCYQQSIHSKQMADRNYKHGYSTRNNREPLYIIWGAMIDRTENTNRSDSKYYSEKGIMVCEEWRNDYTKFREWSLNNGYRPGLSIDRIDNSLGYCPGNCRWIPLNQQNLNKTSNRYLEYNGISKTITDWGRETGLSWNTINSRLKKGLTVGQALGYEI
jgi:hypothetical protein